MSIGSYAYPSIILFPALTISGLSDITSWKLLYRQFREKEGSDEGWWNCCVGSSEKRRVAVRRMVVGLAQVLSPELVLRQGVPRVAIVVYMYDWS